MSDDYRSDPIASRRSLSRRLALPLLAFVAGLLAMGWMLTRWDAAGPFLSWMRPGATPVAERSPQPTRPAAAPPARGPDPAIVEQHVTSLENRLDQIAQRADAAANDSARAEALLVAFAARRAIDRGTPLGYIEGLLRSRFGESQPQAVGTILSASREPVTLADLEADLELVAPRLMGPAPQAGFWAGVKRELADMIVVRRTDLPPATPDARLDRARRALATDHVDRALAEVSRLPARDKAQGWIAKARRYVATQAALDRIEAEALLASTSRQVAPAID